MRAPPCLHKWRACPRAPPLTPSNRYTTANSFASGTTAWDWDNAFFGASAVLQLLRPTILQLQGSTPSAVSTAQTYMARTVRQWLDRTRTCPTYKLGDEMTVRHTPLAHLAALLGCSSPGWC